MWPQWIIVEKFINLNGHTPTSDDKTVTIILLMVITGAACFRLSHLWSSCDISLDVKGLNNSPARTVHSILVKPDPFELMGLRIRTTLFISSNKSKRDGSSGGDKQ